MAEMRLQRELGREVAMPAGLADDRPRVEDVRSPDTAAGDGPYDTVVDTAELPARREPGVEGELEVAEDGGRDLGGGRPDGWPEDAAEVGVGVDQSRQQGQAL